MIQGGRSDGEVSDLSWIEYFKNNRVKELTFWTDSRCPYTVDLDGAMSFVET